MDKKKILLITLLTIFSLIISKFLWTKINIPYSENPNITNIVGIYSKFKYNPINEVIRYLLFIFLPIIVFFLSIQFFYYKNLRRVKDIIYSVNNFQEIKNKSDLNLNFCLIIILLITILNFTSASFPLGKIDMFHEGQRLSAAINYLSNNGLWSSSFMTIGLFYEVLQSLIAFNLFESQSIGSGRLIYILLGLFSKLSLIVLIYQITREVNLEKNYKVIFFLIVCFLILVLTIKNLHNRDLPLLLLLNFLAHTFSTNAKTLITNFLIGILSIFSIIWSIERGVYLNITLLILLIFYLYRRNYLHFFLTVSGITIGWIIFYLAIGQNEFYHFYNNTKDVLVYMDYIYGTIHPVPFSGEDNASRATKILVTIIFSGITVIYLNFFENKIFNNKFKLFFIFLFIFCVISYRNALGLSDSYHMKHSEIFTEILLISLFSYIFLNFITSNKLVSNFINFKIVFNFIIIGLISFIFYFEKVDLKKTFNFNKRLLVYVQQPDNVFLFDNQKKQIADLKYLLNDEKCIDLFTYDAAILYLLNKPSCNKYYYTFTILTENHQKTFINESKVKKTNYIVLNAPNEKFKGLWMPTYQYPLIKNYIEKNYLLFKELGLWNLYQLKKNL
jgi:hypothetical protein